LNPPFSSCLGMTSSGVPGRMNGVLGGIVYELIICLV
jgi:hypothetical protein